MKPAVSTLNFLKEQRMRFAGNGELHYLLFSQFYTFSQIPSLRCHFCTIFQLCSPDELKMRTKPVVECYCIPYIAVFCDAFSYPQLPSPNLLVLYPVTFEIALLHALTVTLIVHRGKARYSRFEDLSDVSLSRNRCRRVYLDQNPTKLGNLCAP